MRTQRFTRGGGLRRGASALVAAALPVGALALGGTANAAARPGLSGATHAPAGVITTVAGGGGGPAPATKVALNSPCGVSFGAGDLYVGDTFSVRRVDPAAGLLPTPAGTGTVTRPFSNGGPATKTSLLDACGATADHSGNVVVSDSGYNRVRVVAAATGTFYGQAMTAGHVYTVAGNGRKGFSGDGGPARDARLHPSWAV